MSKQETTSTQSLPVDQIEPNAAQADGFDGASDPATAFKATDAGASDDNSSHTKAAAGVAKKSGKILGMSKHAFAAVAAVVAVTGAVVVGIVATQQPSVEDWFDSSAQQGQFEGKSKEEIQAALNEEVAKGMMNISIAAVIEFPDGSSEGEARIENIAANPMDQKVSIALKDSGEVVYESGALAPDQHIQNIKLSRDLDPGEYEAVATFTGYDRETHKQTGQAAAEITLVVEG